MEEIKTVTADIKKYVELRTDLVKLEVVEKLSKILASVLFYLLFAVLMICVFFFLSLAVVFALKDLLGGVVYSLLLVSGIFTLIGIVLFLLRKKIFVNTFVKNFSEIIFDDHEKA